MADTEQVQNSQHERVRVDTLPDRTEAPGLSTSNPGFTTLPHWHLQARCYCRSTDAWFA